MVAKAGDLTRVVGFCYGGEIKRAGKPALGLVPRYLYARSSLGSAVNTLKPLDLLGALQKLRTEKFNGALRLPYIS